MQSNLEHPKFSVVNLNYSISEFLQTLYPNIPISFGPTQQAESLPRFYILYYDSTKHEMEIDKMGVAKLYVNIVYEEEYNKKQLYTIYETVAQNIDDNIRKLTYNVYDDELGKIVNAIPLDTHNNSWKSDLSSMQYKFELLLRTKLEQEEVDKIEEVNRDIYAITH